MAIRGTANIKDKGPLPLTCPIDNSHRIPSGHMYEHLVQVHSCSDQGISGDSYLTSRRAGTEDTRWHKREEYECLICEAHGVTRVFRTRQTADEITSNDSLETHLTAAGPTGHGGA